MKIREKFEECEIGDGVLAITVVRDGLDELPPNFEIREVDWNGQKQYAWIRKA